MSNTQPDSQASLLLVGNFETRIGSEAINHETLQLPPVVTLPAVPQSSMPDSSAQSQQILTIGNVVQATTKRKRNPADRNSVMRPNASSTPRFVDAFVIYHTRRFTSDILTGTCVLSNGVKIAKAVPLENSASTGTDLYETRIHWLK